MELPRLTSGKSSRSKGHQKNTDAEQKQTEKDAAQKTTTEEAASTSTAVPSITPARIPTSEDTIALASAVVATLPGTPLVPSQTSNERRDSNVVLPVAPVPPAQTPQPTPAPESTDGDDTEEAASERRGIIHRLFGWN
ncbi:uncharacterized protein [Drosophila pseudoobscura]|uniref:Uncharacterized protein n=1 Tax=Drosophila pseudoobscura pseudoobscura TaxID=46245 RepID=A0A6I8UF38_DROPS|nr:uncharacterized protein LOC4814316 [Drosophila pseudoobscura]